jgi:uncharacterized protein (DUF169 family)
LPTGTIRALAAAPLDEVPDGVSIDVLVCVTDPMRVMQIAGAASAREGTFPIGEVGPSACASLFATPWLTKNSVFATGDGGGRMHNRVGPTEHVRCDSTRAFPLFGRARGRTSESTRSRCGR